MKLNSKPPLYVGRIRWPYRLIVYGALALLVLAYLYAFFQNESGTRIEELYSPYFLGACFIILSSLFHVESRRLLLWEDQFCDSKFLFINRCYRYTEIKRLGEDRLDGYLMIILKDGATILVPEFLLDTSKELDVLGMDLRDFLESKFKYI